MARRGRLFQTQMVSSTVLLIMLLGTAGCHEGVAWHDYDYPRVLADSQANHKLMFVYFRDFASVDCTKFEDGVLKHPSAKTAIAQFYAVPLQWNTLYDAPLVERCQIRKVPSYVIMDPSERVLAKRSFPITLEQLLGDIQRARVTFSGEKPPPSPPSPPPSPSPAQPGAQ